jgi:hypothetical protein
MTRRGVLLVVLLGSVPLVRADETYQPAAPIPTKQITADQPDRYRVLELRLQTHPARITVLVEGMTGQECAKNTDGACQQITAGYDGTEALGFLNTLNTANLTTNSLIKRVLNKLGADGILPPGTVAGAAGWPTYTPTVTQTGTATATDTPTPPGTLTETATATETVSP